MSENLASRRVAVIGAGAMGAGCALTFAVSGFDVALWSRREQSLERARSRVVSDLTSLAGKGLIGCESITRVVGRITTTTGLETAVEGAEFVLESVTEDLEVKRDLFRSLEGLVESDVMLATNTSAISITEIAEACQHRNRVVGTHWWYPPHIIPLVEVVPGAHTDHHTLLYTVDLMREIGKHPVVLKRDAPGFVGSRLQTAMYREAVSIVQSGIADAATVDEVVKFGPGLRWAAVGPCEHLDMIGLDLFLSVCQYLFRHLEDSHGPAPILLEKVAKGELGFKTDGRGFATHTLDDQQAIRERLFEHLVRLTVDAPRVPQDAGNAGTA